MSLDSAHCQRAIEVRLRVKLPRSRRQHAEEQDHRYEGNGEPGSMLIASRPRIIARLALSHHLRRRAPSSVSSRLSRPSGEARHPRRQRFVLVDHGDSPLRFRPIGEHRPQQRLPAPSTRSGFSRPGRHIRASNRRPALALQIVRRHPVLAAREWSHGAARLMSRPTEGLLAAADRERELLRRWPPGVCRVFSRVSMCASRHLRCRGFSCSPRSARAARARASAPREAMSWRHAHAPMKHHAAGIGLLLPAEQCEHHRGAATADIERELPGAGPRALLGDACLELARAAWPRMAEQHTAAVAIDQPMNAQRTSRW